MPCIRERKNLESSLTKSLLFCSRLSDSRTRKNCRKLVRKTQKANLELIKCHGE